jgi:hypothetical protein
VNSILYELHIYSSEPRHAISIIPIFTAFPRTRILSPELPSHRRACSHDLSIHNVQPNYLAEQRRHFPLVVYGKRRRLALPILPLSYFCPHYGLGPHHPATMSLVRRPPRSSLIRPQYELRLQQNWLLGFGLGNTTPIQRLGVWSE